MSAAECADRAEGLLLGLAAGDENGGPLEMALCLAQSLLERREFRAADVGDRYLAWYRDPANTHVTWDTGPTAERVFRNSSTGADLPDAAAAVHKELNGMTAGVNSVHRAGPLAAAAWLDDEAAWRAAWDESGLTHHSDLARGCSAAFVALCRGLIQGRPLGDCLQRAAELPCLEELPVIPRILEEARVLLGGGLRARLQHRQGLQPGGFCVHALAAALHFAASAEDPEEVLAEAKKFAGADNYCPVLVGALLGARLGAAALPKPPGRSRSHTEERYAALLDRRGGVRAAARALGRTWLEQGT